MPHQNDALRQNDDDGHSSEPASVPVARVPPEILCDIFGYFTSRDSLDEYRELANLRKADLLRLARVCSHWHTLVMGTPALWSEIEVTSSYWSWKSQTRCIRALKACLDRSVEHPLALRLNLGGTDSNLLRPLIKNLADHSERWQCLSLSIEPNKAELLRLVKGKLGTLQELSLQFVYGNYDVDIQDRIDIFENAPKLRHVLLYSLPNRHFLRLPLKQLSSFTFQDNGTKGFLDVMRNLSAPGATFKFQHTWPRNALCQFPLALTTSGISAFIVELASASIPQRLVELLGAVLDSLIFTNLHTLDVLRKGPGFPPTFWPVDQFEALARRSAFQNTLRSLDLLAVCITQDELLRSLAALGSLESLSIADHPIIRSQQCALLTDALLSQLTWSPDGADSHSRAHLVPRLNRLHCDALFRFTPQVYRDFIASRIAAGAGGAPFENSLFRMRDASSEVADRVIGELKPMVRERTLRLEYSSET
ncbi:hypothetical protein GGX14DRAFT_699233 [Mycena pura]|uniref:F-box domain-containing protein n=1 Tax=Mycena pura TaxID=153505 RepID=A0AAD6Y6U3_9AGAR|nr:hypothetical protein GGX14DRAFT_699233 [Mycena pura]